MLSNIDKQLPATVVELARHPSESDIGQCVKMYSNGYGTDRCHGRLIKLRQDL